LLGLCSQALVFQFLSQKLGNLGFGGEGQVLLAILAWFGKCQVNFFVVGLYNCFFK